MSGNQPHPAGTQVEQPPESTAWASPAPAVPASFVDDQTCLEQAQEEEPLVVMDAPAQADAGTCCGSGQDAGPDTKHLVELTPSETEHSAERNDNDVHDDDDDEYYYVPTGTDDAHASASNSPGASSSHSPPASAPGETIIVYEDLSTKDDDIEHSNDRRASPRSIPRGTRKAVRPAAPRTTATQGPNCDDDDVDEFEHWSTAYVPSSQASPPAAAAAPPSRQDLLHQVEARLHEVRHGHPALHYVRRRLQAPESEGPSRGGRQPRETPSRARGREQYGQPAHQLRCSHCGRRLKPQPPALEPALYQRQWLRSPSTSPHLPPSGPRAKTSSHRRHHHRQHDAGPAPTTTPSSIRERYDGRDVEDFVYSVPVVSAPRSSYTSHTSTTQAGAAAAAAVRGYHALEEPMEDGVDGGINLFYGPQRMVFRWHDPVPAGVMMNNNDDDDLNKMGAGYYHPHHHPAAMLSRGEEIPTTAAAAYQVPSARPHFMDDDYATPRYYTHGAAPVPAELADSSTNNPYFLPSFGGYEVAHQY